MDKKSDVVLIHKEGRGYYRPEAHGYAYLDGAGFFTRQRAENEAGTEEAIRLVEPREVVGQAVRERDLLRQRIAVLDRIIMLGTS